MNVEIGTDAAQFPEKENINGIFVAVSFHFYILVNPRNICNIPAIYFIVCDEICPCLDDIPERKNMLCVQVETSPQIFSLILSLFSPTSHPLAFFSFPFSFL
jgi:hypothetical protein